MVLALLGILIPLAATLDWFLKPRVRRVVTKFLLRASKKTSDPTARVKIVQDRIFGLRLLSARALSLYVCASILSVITAFTFVGVLNHQTFTSNIEDFTSSASTPLGLMILATFLIFNTLGDVASYIQTRIFINAAFSLRSQSIKAIFVPFDALISLVIFLITYSFGKIITMLLLAGSLSGNYMTLSFSFSPDFLLEALSDYEIELDSLPTTEVDGHYYNRLSRLVLQRQDFDSPEFLAEVEEIAFSRRRSENINPEKFINVSAEFECINLSRAAQAFMSEAFFDTSTSMLASLYVYNRYGDGSEESSLNELDLLLIDLVERRLVSNPECPISSITYEFEYESVSLLQEAGLWSSYISSFYMSSVKLLNLIYFNFSYYLSDEQYSVFRSELATIMTHAYFEESYVGQRIVDDLRSDSFVDIEREVHVPFTSFSVSGLFTTLLYGGFMGIFIVLQIYSKMTILFRYAFLFTLIRRFPFTGIAIVTAFSVLLVTAICWLASTAWSLGVGMFS